MYLKKRCKQTGLALAVFLSLHAGQMEPAYMMEAPEETVVLPSEGFAKQEVKINGNTKIATEQLQTTVGKAEGVEAREKIMKAYANAGYNLVDVTVKEEQGTRVLQVTEKRLGKVVVEGNKQSSEKDIRQMLPALKEGNVPNVRYLSCQVMLANDSGFRQLSVDFRPNGADKVDAYVTVKEADSVKYITSIDNTGDGYTGKLRTNLTLVDGNAGGKGHTAVVSYTTSPDNTDEVKQVGFYYNIPLPQANNNLYFTASYSDVDSGRIIDQGGYALDASGKGSSVGLHYVHNLERSEANKESVDFGIDMRKYDSDNIFNVAGYPVDIGVDITSMPLSLTYQKSTKTADTVTSYSLGYVHNLPSGSANDTAQYEQYRAGTNANYQLWRGSANYQHMFRSGWLANVSVSGQYTGERLIYPEQFGLGGAHSLRGMNERDVAGDNGIQGSFELYTPEIAKGQRLVGFFDVGRFWNVDPLPGDLRGDTAATIGLGWRYHDVNGYHFVADWGYVLNGTLNTPDHSSKFHFLASKVY